MQRTLLVALSLALLPACARDVTVRVVSEYGGGPLAGIRVQVDRGEWAVTDARGEAAFRAVEPGFLLRVHQVSSRPGFRSDDVWELQGPEGELVVVLADSDRPFLFSSVEGSVTGWSGGVVRVFASTNLRGEMPWSSITTDAKFGIGVYWEGPAPLGSVVRALESEGAWPDEHYRAYGESAWVTLDDPGLGGSVEGISVALQPVSEVSVPAQLPVVPGPLLIRARATLRFPEGEIDLGQGTGLGESIQARFPLVPGASRWLEVSTVDRQDPFSPWSSHAKAVNTVQSVAAFDLPEPVELVEPPDQAVVGMDTVFRWKGGPGGGRSALTAICSWTDGAGVRRSVNYRVLESTGEEASLPDLAPELVVDPGASCQWSVGWSPASLHLGATQADRDASEVRISMSRARTAVVR